MFQTIISCEKLNENLGGDDWVIVDVRHYLKDKSLGYENYKKNHIPGAIFADLEKDLSGEITTTSGRHPLPNEEIFMEKLGSWGIDSTKQVVVYDDVGGAICSRLWWLLQFLGHRNVAVLDGGYRCWQKNKFQVTTEKPRPKKTLFSKKTSRFKTIQLDEVSKELDKYTIIDSRAPQRFRGEVEPIDPIAGHIPGAKNYFFKDNLNLNESDIFVSKDMLKSRFAEFTTVNNDIVVYCGSGVTACHNILAMEMAGILGAKLFVGSWSKWCRNGSLPMR